MTFYEKLGYTSIFYDISMLDAAENSAHTENARPKKLVALPLKLRREGLLGACKL
jgi:hypothetical protein